MGRERRATIALRRPEPVEVGSRVMGCISFTVRVAPIGRADDGAIDSGIIIKSKLGWREGDLVFTFAYT
jgi:hypothetical protein